MYWMFNPKLYFSLLEITAQTCILWHAEKWLWTTTTKRVQSTGEAQIKNTKLRHSEVLSCIITEITLAMSEKPCRNKNVSYSAWPVHVHLRQFPRFGVNDNRTAMFQHNSHERMLRIILAIDQRNVTECRITARSIAFAIQLAQCLFPAPAGHFLC